MNEDRFAKLLSFVFHPLLMPTYGLITLFYGMDAYFALILPTKAKLILLTVVFLTTFFFPSLAVIVLNRFGVVSDLELMNRKERYLPFVFTLTLYIATWIMFRRAGLPYQMTAMILAACLVIIACLAITFFVKISIHLMGLGGFFGIFYAFAMLDGYPLNGILVSALLAAGLTGFARLRLEAHTLPQVLWGFTLGVVIGFAPLYILMS